MVVEQLSKYKVKDRGGFSVSRGDPQGSSFTSTLFITYHNDMANFFPGDTSFCFVDGLAAILVGRMGVKFTEQCIDLERRFQMFLAQLEFYSTLTVQAINHFKTQVVFSARAVCYPNPMPDLAYGDQTLEWVSSFKYRGYWLITKLGWGNIIVKTRISIRQQTAVINSFSHSGTSFGKVKTYSLLYSRTTSSYLAPRTVSPVYRLSTKRTRSSILHVIEESIPLSL